MRHLRSRGSRALTAVLAGTFLLSGLAAGTASAQTRLTYKSASAGTAYYQMGVELSEAIKAGTEGEVTLTLEESQGSVQNVMEVMARPGNYVFTSPPGLVSKARESSGRSRTATIRASRRFARCSRFHH